MLYIVFALFPRGHFFLTIPRNNVALAAAFLAKTHGVRVAVLDVDVHAGDGTMLIFKNCEDILTVSLHVDPKFEYPYVYGHAHESNASNLNVPLPPKTQWREYSRALAGALERMKAFDAPFWLIAFGADTYKDDPDMSNISGLSLDLSDYTSMGQQIRLAAGNREILVTAEGGYCMEKVPFCRAMLRCCHG